MTTTLFPEQDTSTRHHPTLRSYQRIGAEWLAGRKGGLIADMMGLGKTCQAITAALALPAERVLIVAPLATALGWQREVTLWGGPEVTILRRKHATPSGAGWYFVPWTDLAHRLPSLLTAGAWDVVIYDEVHRAKAGSRTQTGEAAWGKWSKDRSSGSWQRNPGLVDRAERLWCLTGTPMPNGRPIEAYAMLNALGCSVARSRAKYVERYCARPNSFAPRGFDEMGAQNLPELNRYMAEVMLRRTPETVPGELPELLRVTVPLEGEDAEHGNVQVEVDDYGRVTITSGGLPAFEEMARYRAELGEMKIPAVVEWVKDYVSGEGDANRPLVVFTHHKAVARGIAEGLPAGWAIVATGDDQPDVRQGKVDQFARADGPPVFVGTAPACGTGMNGLHKRTNVCAFAEGEWSPSDLDQAEGRIRRIGSVAGDTLAHYLLVADSLEEHIMLTINAKRENIKHGVDGEATEHAAIVPPPAPVTQSARALRDTAPAPAPEPAPVPLPHAADWSFGRDTSGDWCARANHRGGPSWQGADVTLVTRDGREKAVVLGACVRSGADWSMWKFSTRIDTGGAAKRVKFNSRGAGRGIEGATDATPCSAAEQPAIQACIVAAARLCALDDDHAEYQNGVGWRKGDHTCGKMMSEIPPDAWTKGTLTFARALLRVYSRTQITDLWPIINGGQE